MKLLIIGSLILLSNLAHAGPTISPMDNDRASTLMENNKAITKANNGCKNNKSKININLANTILMIIARLKVAK